MKYIPARKEPVGFVGPFTHWHNFKPAPFNPQYDPRAEGWATLATYDTARAGGYSLPREEAKKMRDSFYDKRKEAGDYSRQELQKAKEYLYNL